MRKKLFHWLDKEFVLLSAEGRPAKSAADEARDLFQRLDDELKGLGLSLDNTVRTRLWGRDRENRDHGSAERVKILWRDPLVRASSLPSILIPMREWQSISWPCGLQM